MVIELIVPAQLVPVPKSTTAKHRYDEGVEHPTTGRIVGATPAMWKVDNVLERHDWDPKPRTRRSR